MVAKPMHLSEVDCRSTATITAFACRQRLEASRAMAGATNVETEWVYVPDDAVIFRPAATPPYVQIRSLER
jgi:hypothetical protein